MKPITFKHITLLLILLTATLSSSGANVAADIVAKAVNRYQSVPSLTVNFKISSPGTQSSSGTLVTAGDRFHLNMPDMQTWYDGRTQWSYLRAANEVNITEPTVDELAQINPFAMVSAINSMFTPALIKSGQQTQVIRFTPKRANESDIISLTVTFDQSTSWPKTIDILSQQGQVTITVTNIKTGSKLPVSTFVYNKKTHPGAEIVDLR